MMAPTRQPPPIHIFQDPLPPHPSFNQATRPRPQLQPSAMPLQPLNNPPHRSDVLISPPSHGLQPISPLKSQPLSPSMPNYQNLGYVPIPPPPTADMYTDSVVKRDPGSYPQQYRPVSYSQQPLFTTFHSNFDTYDQENFHPQPLQTNNYADFPEPSFIRKQNLKRSYSDAATSDRPLKKPRQEEESAQTLPAPEDMPLVEDDGTKPTYSYASMIGMAILRAPNRRLTLAQIYEWISNTFAFYREDTRQGWHNSIRHNLSLNKAFKKVERPKGDAGKGSYWTIEEGLEMNFVKDKIRKGTTLANITVHQTITRMDPPAMIQPLADALAPNQWLAETVEPVRPQTAPALPELSSDATVPASDPALDEEDSGVNHPQALSQPLSSPPAAMNSSPPVSQMQHHRSESSPGARRRMSMTRPHKRVVTAMDDSGYFSSLESSVLRPNKASNVVLTSEIDIEPLKRRTGRAEEEIARIRSSSHDITPSHGRFRAGTSMVGSSSPVRENSTKKLNPMTPSVVFKKPARPPPSVSPNTQLYLHRREMEHWTNSPLKKVDNFAHGLLGAYSPCFKTPGGASFGTFEEQFQLFDETGLNFTPHTSAFVSSPLKHSVSRPGIQRANTSSAVLSQITGSNSRLNAKSPGKLLKPSYKTSYAGSPLRGSVILDDQEELFDFGSFADEPSDEGEGFDILQGFEKIGHQQSQPPMVPQHSHRPSLGRSFTSRF